MAAKTPKKFRQARKAAKKDAKKVFSGKKQAGLKDKSPLMKFSADDQKALDDVKKEAKGKFITDDKGNKIKTTNITSKEAAAEYKRVTDARNEAFRSSMRAEFGEYAGKKATQADYDSNPKFKDRAPKAAPSKPAPKVTEAGKVRSAVTATEPKPQSFKIDKDGKKIRPKGFKTVKNAGDVRKAATAEKKVFKSTKTMGEISKAVADKTKTPVVKKGFAAGKELNAEGKAIYDKLIKDGVKPKSALNKALFRQEKGAKVAAKAAAPVAKAAKSAATAVKKQGPVKAPSTMGSMGTTRPEGLTPKVQKEIKAKYKASNAATKPAATPAVKKAATVKKATTVNKASTASKVGKAVLEAGKATAMIAGPGKFLKIGGLVKGAVTGTKAVKVAKAASAAKPGTKVLAANTARKAANVEKKAKKASMSKGKKALRATGITAGLYGIGSLPVGGGKGKESATTTPRPVRPAGALPKGGGKGLKFGPNVQVNAGGSTTSYTIKKGDTLSGVAKTSGVKLSELLAANPKIADKKSKYKGGSMVWSGTKVKIPTKK
jgi:hypothetical protein